MSEPFYITTPIYYVTDAPHIGHLYTTLACDIMARFQKHLGKNVWFLTGTDEHGQKIQKKAKETGETPQALADRVVQRYQKAWERYEIEYNDFIRTTESRHIKVVQAYIKKLIDKGDIYLGSYEGWYCIPCESYWTETQLKEGKCPDCGRPVELLKEESYFFRMSAYQDKLIEHIGAHPDFIYPESRRNEVTSFIRQGLKDISASRTTIEWGIPFPQDLKATKTHKVYVWFDALTNYLSALGPLDNDPKYKTFWNSAIHVVGKDILRFHAVYWPTFLMALDLPLPKRIVAHGWLTDTNKKISKSLGNVVDPITLADQIGADGIRYFLFREFVFGLDGEYTEDTLYQRVNADLSNDYGNCVSRVVAMIQKYFGTEALSSKSLSNPSPLKVACASAPKEIQSSLERFEFHRALEQVWKVLSEVNRFIDSSAPWVLGKSTKKEDRDRLEEVLVHCHESLRICSLWLHPFIPKSALKALTQLGASPQKDFILPTIAVWGKGPAEIRVNRGDPLFPRLERKKDAH